MQDKLLPGSFWQHWKGKIYKVIAICHNASLENPEEGGKFVVYQSQYNDEKYGNNAYWFRGIDEFLQKFQPLVSDK